MNLVQVIAKSCYEVSGALWTRGRELCSFVFYDWLRKAMVC